MKMLYDQFGVYVCAGIWSTYWNWAIDPRIKNLGFLALWLARRERESPKATQKPKFKQEIYWSQRHLCKANEIIIWLNSNCSQSGSCCLFDYYVWHFLLIYLNTLESHTAYIYHKHIWKHISLLSGGNVKKKKQNQKKMPEKNPFIKKWMVKNKRDRSTALFLCSFFFQSLS